MQISLPTAIVTLRMITLGLVSSTEAILRYLDKVARCDISSRHSRVV